ncbi:hydrogenase maturation nickel metallochaperone HypA [Streptacidiphilus jiangxiensis]|uniref:Hydrogenase maturation factor HypA n=1 Tax=Streptacidiphilus jiangxiensis TaxID=235985 RepID=A0A1H7NEX8_STRJI|nr:hydrogenase maturation nickel metallochaperone HypA [Streptacidiphilus jiangxiensis]SEL21518.1 hydrogenase nickel incorporation protein HypA/HybF [Streptacidiphilus jiangxiensis]
MHEMSIALAVVGQVETAARALGEVDGAAPTARTVTLRVGELAGVVPDSLRFCFELACADTLLAGATLLTENVPGRAHCEPCDRDWATGLPPDLCCPRCDSGASELTAGRELEIAEVRWSEPACAAPPKED